MSVLRGRRQDCRGRFGRNRRLCRRARRGNHEHRQRTWPGGHDWPIPIIDWRERTRRVSWNRRMRIAIAVAILAGALAAPALSQAQSRPFPSPPGNNAPLPGQPRINPNVPLPRTLPVPSPQVSGNSTTQQPPTVVCGMTLVPADPKFDSAIRRPAPDKPAPRIGMITPPVCRR